MPRPKFRSAWKCLSVLMACSLLLVSYLAAPATYGQQDIQQNQQEADFGFFFETLSPYGEWVEVAGYGTCWRPNVAKDWAPYTEGSWAYTDVGWTWVSREPFGAVAFHYGRWLFTNIGWVWVPGYEWGPAWVSWRNGNDYIGWAPLPPEVPWYPQRGISTWVDVHTDIGPGYYRFCPVRDFGSPYLADVLIPYSRNTLIIQRTQNVTNITIYNGNVFCGGPRYEWVRSRSAQPVPMMRVVREENLDRYRALAGGGGAFLGYVHEDLFVLPAPSRVRAVEPRYFSAPIPAWQGTLSRGWHGEESQRREVQAHYSRDWAEAQASGQGSRAAVAAPETKWIPRSATPSERTGAISVSIPKVPVVDPTLVRPSSSPAAVPVAVPVVGSGGMGGLPVLGGTVSNHPSGSHPLGTNQNGILGQGSRPSGMVPQVPRPASSQPESIPVHPVVPQSVNTPGQVVRPTSGVLPPAGSRSTVQPTPLGVEPQNPAQPRVPQTGRQPQTIGTQPFQVQAVPVVSGQVPARVQSTTPVSSARPSVSPQTSPPQGVPSAPATNSRNPVLPSPAPAATPSQTPDPRRKKDDPLGSGATLNIRP